MGKKDLMASPHRRGVRIEELFHKSLVSMRRAFSGDAGEFTGSVYRYFLEGEYKARWKQALVNLYGEACAHMPRHSAYSTKERSFYELFAFSQMTPQYNYNLLDMGGALRIGAAMWILEQIADTGKLDEAVKALPDPEKMFPEDFHMFAVEHALFSASLVEAMASAITCRYADGGEFNKHDFMGCVIPKQLVQKKPLTWDWQKIVSLIPQEAIDRACDLFRKKLWQVAELFMDISESFAKRHDLINMEILSATQGSARFPSGKVIPGVSSRPAVVFIDDDSEGKRLLRSFGDINENRQSMYDVVSDFGPLLSADRDRLDRTGLEKELCDRLEAFDAGDPFALCFALFYLLDKGDDLPWLLYSGGALMVAAYAKLPWGDRDDQGVAKQIYGMPLPGEKEEEEPESVSPPVPEEHYEYYGARENGLTLAQVLFRTGKVAVPYGYSPYAEKVRELVGDGCDSETFRHLVGVSGLLALKREGGYAARLFLENNRGSLQEEELTDKIRCLEEEKGKAEQALLQANREIGRLEEENRKLREEMERERQDAERQARRHREDARDMERERRELFDLREILFNAENNTEDGFVEQKDGGDMYPYALQKKTVVFGGHDTFLKVMRANFPGARFIDRKELSFSPDVIRGADVVWIQNNCISHPQYWAVVKYASQYGKPLRYFTSSGAARCSAQMAEADKTA